MRRSGEKNYNRGGVKCPYEDMRTLQFGPRRSVRDMSLLYRARESSGGQMKKLLALTFLIGLASGQANKNLSAYGCTVMRHDYNGNTYQTQICIVYDPNTDRHFIVSSSTSGGTAIVEEK